MLAPSPVERVHDILRGHARLPVDPATLPQTADLYDAGMTSHASVSVMLALEEGFDVEFPDRMLTRSVFASVSSICGAIAQIEQNEGA
jgi:acyl carrier protein